MKKILVVYYTQSGQLKQIVDSVISPIEKEENIQIDFEQIKPDPNYPFPWKTEFFNCFPESVMGIPCPLKPFSFNPDADYDLVILAYQPWYLSPSIPFSSFLQSEPAKKLLKNKPVITLQGVRNMNYMAQEDVKKLLVKANANLVGNIVLKDRSDNIIAGITIIRWLVHGKKGPSAILPAGGVSIKDIKESEKFGFTIKKHLFNNSFTQLQPQLIKQGAVQIRFHLLFVEKTAKKIFLKFAKFVLAKGKAGNPARAGRISLFKGYILFALFLLSPIVSFIYMIIRVLLFPIANKQLRYYKGVTLK